MEKNQKFFLLKRTTMNFKNTVEEPGSYKDSSGRVVYIDGAVVRIVHDSFKQECLDIIESTFYQKCIDKGYLTGFEVKKNGDQLALISDRIDTFIYPYEWGFEQMKSAAIFQLDFLQYCLEHGYTLKDASPFNIQFVDGKPVFIDLLSVVKYEDTSPWYAYKQFCEMFVSPLVLSVYVKGSWIKQLLLDLDGMSLLVVSKLLPFKARFNSLVFFHIISLSKYKKKASANEVKIPKRKVSSIIKHLKVEIEDLKPISSSKQWLNYANEFPYSKDEIKNKSQVLTNWLKLQDTKLLLDIGANHTSFVNDDSPRFKQMVLMDNDAEVVDGLFLNQKQPGVSVVQMDVTMMSPCVGLNLKERSSFVERVKPSVVLGLALIHHIFHQRNVPLDKIAEMFNMFNGNLIVEFIEESDEKFQLIKNPQNKHPYSKSIFEACFSNYYKLEEVVEVKKGKRHMYLMSKING
ncbi:MAG: hypothetical protein ACJA0Q_000944 [Saprospiraceae bacterium]